MKSINRRAFLKLASASTIVATGSVVGGSGLPAELQSLTKHGNSYQFRAVTGLPRHPFPAYASFVVEGRINLARRSGTATTTLFAGAPEAMSGLAFPGTTRLIRITDVQRAGDTLLLTGSVDDRAQLWRGESGAVEMFIDLAARSMRTGFLGVAVPLALQR